MVLEPSSTSRHSWHIIQLFCWHKHDSEIIKEEWIRYGSRHHDPARQTPWPGLVDTMGRPGRHHGRPGNILYSRVIHEIRGAITSQSLRSDFPSRRREKVSVLPSRRRLAWPLRRDNRHLATDCLRRDKSVSKPRSSDGTRWHSVVGSDNVVYIEQPIPSKQPVPRVWGDAR